MQDLGRASGDDLPVTSLWDLHRAHTPVHTQQSVHSGSTLSVEREAEHRGGERQEGDTLGLVKASLAMSFYYVQATGLSSSSH